MRFLQVTNIVSHHQIPVARQISQLVGANNFRFATTKPPDDERQKLGWDDKVNDPWIIRAGEYDKDRIEFEKWWDQADVVICGDRRFRRMQDRLDRGKLTFYMSERWWKPPVGKFRLFHPRFALMTAYFLKMSKSPLFHYLSKGEFAAVDMRWLAPLKGRMWQWGYLTEPPIPLPSCNRKGNSLRILWAGRMLAWKRVDTLIRAFAQVQQERPDAILTLVGDGPERISIERICKKILPRGNYRLLDPVPAERVIELMKQHHVYVLPSNGYEGWGAVTNEAMSAGCAVIASSAAGAARTMIKPGVNGLLFEPGDWRLLADHLLLLSRNGTMRHQLAIAGQRTISECWSPAVAAERFLNVSAALLADRPGPTFTNGPMAQGRIL